MKKIYTAVLALVIVFSGFVYAQKTHAIDTWIMSYDTPNPNDYPWLCLNVWQDVNGNYYTTTGTWNGYGQCVSLAVDASSDDSETQFNLVSMVYDFIITTVGEQGTEISDDANLCPPMCDSATGTEEQGSGMSDDTNLCPPVCDSAIKTEE